MENNKVLFVENRVDVMVNTTTLTFDLNLTPEKQTTSFSFMDQHFSFTYDNVELSMLYFNTMPLSPCDEFTLTCKLTDPYGNKIEKLNQSFLTLLFHEHKMELSNSSKISLSLSFPITIPPPKKWIPSSPSSSTLIEDTLKYIHIEENGVPKGEFFSHLNPDIVFQVAQQHVFKAHKIILAHRSPYFYRCFTSSFVEGKSRVPPPFEYSHVSVTAFQSMLDYIYFHTLPPFDLQQAYELLSLSHLWELKKLYSFCWTVIVTFINIDNVVDLWKLSRKFDEKGVHAISLEFIHVRFKSVLGTESWKNLIQNEPDLAIEISLCEYNRK